MRKVFVINKSGHDYSKAKRFGELVFLSEGMLSKANLNTVYRKFAETLDHSNPDDYILMTGLTELNMVASAIMGHKHDRLNVLIWSPKTKDYESRELLISNLISK